MRCYVPESVIPDVSGDRIKVLWCFETPGTANPATPVRRPECCIVRNVYLQTCDFLDGTKQLL